MPSSGRSKTRGCCAGSLAAFTLLGAIFAFQAVFAEKPLILRGHRQHIATLKFSPDGKLLASGSWEGSVKLWDTQTGLCIRTLSAPLLHPRSLAFSPDGRKIADGDLNYKVIVWDVATGTVYRTLSGHIDEVSCVDFSPDGKLLASGGHEKVAYIWDIEAGKRIKQFWKHKNWVGPVAFAPDGRTLATGDYESIQTWHVSSGQRLTKTPNPLNHWFQYSRDGKLLLSGGIYAPLTIWDTTRWKTIFSQGAKYPNRVMAIDASANNRFITAELNTATNSVVYVRDMRTGQYLSKVGDYGQDSKWPSWLLRIAPFIRAPGPSSVSNVAISPDGKLAAVSGTDPEIKIWKLR